MTKDSGLKLTLPIKFGGNTIAVAPVGGLLVVDEAGEGSKAGIIGVGLALEGRSNGCAEAGVVVLGDPGEPVVSCGTGDSNSRGAGSESEDGGREVHYD